MNDSLPVACLLLCAGQGQRMRSSPKLLLPFGDDLVITKVVREIHASSFDELIAVTGFAQEKMESVLGPLGVRTVFNPLYEAGMHASIRTGLLALRQTGGFVAICLGDLPLLNKNHYQKLIETARRNPDAKIIAPTYGEKQGNPVLISLALKSEILAHPDDDYGCSYLLKKYPDFILKVDMQDDSILTDIDTQEDYQCLLTTTNL